MDPKKNTVITVPFSALHTQDDNDTISQLDKANSAGVSFNITQAEYDEIQRIQRKLEEYRPGGQHSVACSFVALRWEVNPDLNFDMNACEFWPKCVLLEVDLYGVDLVMYHRGMLAACVRAEITGLLRAAFEPQEAVANPEPATEP